MITSQQMQELEEHAEKQGISKLKLMENAGRQVYSVIKEKFDLTNKHLVIFAGSGNNAGDGFVAARYFAQDCPVIILFFGEEIKLKKEAKENYQKIKDKINIIKIKKTLEKFYFQKHLELILIDALLGTGIKGKIREPLSLGIDLFNSLKGKKIAIDLPSGLDPDTGKVHDKVCQVDLIITFHDLKTGLKKFKGKTIVVDIGIP